MPAFGTRSSLFWWASGACIQDQIIPLQGLLGPAFGTKSSLFWWVSGACIRDQIIPLLGASGACIRDQIIPLQGASGPYRARIMKVNPYPVTPPRQFWSEPSLSPGKFTTTSRPKFSRIITCPILDWTIWYSA